MSDSPTPARRVDVDLLVVGAGPAGLYAAYYAGFRGLSVAVLDSLPEPGGQVSAMYPEKLIFDVAGFPAVKGRDLVDGLVRQAGRFSPTYLLGQRADSLTSTGYDEPGAGRVAVRTHQGVAVTARAVVITGGIGTFTPRPLPAAAGYEGRGLTYFVPQPQDFLDQDVVVVGGGDSAVDWALTLEPIARSVVLVHRREEFRAHAHSVQLLRASSVEVVTNAQVTAVQGEECIDHVEVTVLPAKTSRIIKAQGVVAALGFTANLGPMARWGLELVDNRHIPVDTRMATRVPGVFAAGDIVDYPGKVRLIAVGFGEAATAVNNAAVLLDPHASVFPGHSTEEQAVA